MKSRVLAGIAITFLLFGMVDQVKAELIKIGYLSRFAGTEVIKSELFWSSKTSLVWLNDSAPPANWQDQNNWAAGLNAIAPVIDPGYNVHWQNSWSLAEQDQMVHLYYTDLENKPGSYLNNGGLDNIHGTTHWSGTTYADNPTRAWTFAMEKGSENNHDKKRAYLHGIAVRSAQVSAVPVPGALWLLASGLAGLAALNRRKTMSLKSNP